VEIRESAKKMKDIRGDLDRIHRTKSQKSVSKKHDENTLAKKQQKERGRCTKKGTENRFMKKKWGHSCASLQEGTGKQRQKRNRRSFEPGIKKKKHKNHTKKGEDI